METACWVSRSGSWIRAHRCRRRFFGIGDASFADVAIEATAGRSTTALRCPARRSSQATAASSLLGTVRALRVTAPRLRRPMSSH
jgi:hypothetical protein